MAISRDNLRQVETEKGGRPEDADVQEDYSSASFSRENEEKSLPDSNRGWRICNPLPASHKAKDTRRVTETQPEDLAQSLAPNPQIDPDLARITDAWHTLPPYVKAAILALAKTSG
jgi:hypothetical protein